MAQHDQVIDNGPGLTVRTDINAALAAIFSCSSGPVQPAVMVPGQLWYDTSTNPPTTRQRNGANTAWGTLSGLSADGLTLYLKEGATTRGSVAAGGGADLGTLALRVFNGAGAQVGLTWFNTFEIGTGYSSFGFYNDAEQALWFRASNGAVRAALYNYSNGAIQLRSYNNVGTLVNLLSVEPDKNLFTHSVNITLNSAGSDSDSAIIHRVGSVRSVRWYYARNGDIYCQESDDNFQSHFLGPFTYYRSTQAVTFPAYVYAGTFEPTGPYGAVGITKGPGDNAAFNSYNLKISSWFGIGFPSSTDDVCRIVFDCRNGNIAITNRLWARDIELTSRLWFASGSFVETDGNIKFSQGMLQFGSDLGSVLNAKVSVSQSGDRNEINFPVGHNVVSYSNGAPTRNEAYTVYTAAGTYHQYTLNINAEYLLAGTWRARGFVPYLDGNHFIGGMQRVS